MFFKKKNVNTTEVDYDNLPKHIGIIMDGNGRWAKKRGLPRSAGHREGAKTLEKITRFAGDIGIRYITYYAFSTENWKRPSKEVESLMKNYRKTRRFIGRNFGKNQNCRRKHEAQQ